MEERLAQRDLGRSSLLFSEEDSELESSDPDSESDPLNEGLTAPRAAVRPPLKYLELLELDSSLDDSSSATGFLTPIGLGFSDGMVCTSPAAKS